VGRAHGEINAAANNPGWPVSLMLSRGVNSTGVASAPHAPAKPVALEAIGGTGSQPATNPICRIARPGAFINRVNHSDQTKLELVPALIHLFFLKLTPVHTPRPNGHCLVSHGIEAFEGVGN
jgi:hypothetical protein